MDLPDPGGPAMRIPLWLSLSRVFEHRVMPVRVKAHLGHGPDGGYLQAIGEWRLGYGDSHGPDLDYGGTYLLHLDVAFRIRLGSLVDLPREVSELPFG